MNRATFVHETAIRAAAAMSAIRGPTMIGCVEGLGMVLNPAEIATRARQVALALAAEFDRDYRETADWVGSDWGGP